MSDYTPKLQEMISAASSKTVAQPNRSDEFATICLDKGDYAIQMLRIPRNARVLVSSRDRVRILYTGKRNRPMFVLEDGSELILKGKIELYYNTNNIQEASKLMIRSSERNKVEISKEVKVMLFSVKQ